MDILSSNKVLQLEPLAPLIRQGERLADNPVFVLPKMRDGIDQTALAWEIRATSDHDTIVIQSLTADLTGTDIRLPWVVEGEFTAVAGALYITLCGKSATSDIVVKYVGSTALRVLAAEEGAYAPPPNIAEQTYQQRAAAEAAAASADATLAQTQALKDQVQVIVAGNEAHTKSESNARFAGALVVKESGNPITVYPDATGAPLTAISQRGKTNQPGTGDPSPTNIRPIYGVGQYDKKVVFDGTKIPTEVTAESATVPNLYQCGFRVGDTTFISICDKFVEQQVGFADVTKPSYRSYTNGYIYFREYGLDTKEKWVEYFKSNPITVYYQSTKYATATQVYIGLSVTDANGYHGYAAGPTAPLYDGDTVDFGTGECKRTKGYIASYAGEALPGKWISDRDVYVAGATPTTGAQVVYELSTPTTETVPISEPITYAPGPITIAAENTVDVTYNKSLAKAFEQITAAIASLGTV